MAVKAAGGRPAPWFFLVGAIVWTWFCFALVIWSGKPWLEFPIAILSLLGGLGPLIVSVLLIASGYWQRDPDAWRFLRRVLNPGSLKLSWWGATLGLVLLTVLSPALVQLLLSPGKVFWEIGPTAFLSIGFVFGALEEVGWRGYAQESLQKRVPIWLAGLIIGAFWSLWHLPLFFVEGTYQAQLGLGTLSFWTFMLGPVVASPFYAWLYNVTGRTTFAVVLYHGVSNVGRELIADPHPVFALLVEALLAAVVVIVSWRWMQRRC